MFYTLKRVPRWQPKDSPFHSHDGINDIQPDELSMVPMEGFSQELLEETGMYRYNTKNTEYWAGDDKFTKVKGHIKYSDSLKKIRKVRNYNLSHNKLPGAYIGIVELFKDSQGRITFGEDKV
jgi:hypothetical protein